MKQLAKKISWKGMFQAEMGCSKAFLRSTLVECYREGRSQVTQGYMDNSQNLDFGSEYRGELYR